MKPGWAICIFRSEDYRLYLNLLAEYARLGYCLMPNHVHLILVPRDAEDLGRLFRRLHGDCARAIHGRLRRKGHLFQARYQSVPMDENISGRQWFMSSKIRGGPD